MTFFPGVIEMLLFSSESCHKPVNVAFSADSVVLAERPWKVQSNDDLIPSALSD